MESLNVITVTGHIFNRLGGGTRGTDYWWGATPVLWRRPPMAEKKCPLPPNGIRLSGSLRVKLALTVRGDLEYKRRRRV
jgi:hypothetical protein